MVAIYVDVEALHPELLRLLSSVLIELRSPPHRPEGLSQHRKYLHAINIDPTLTRLLTANSPPSLPVTYWTEYAAMQLHVY